MTSTAVVRTPVRHCTRGLVAATALVAGLSIPITGAGSAIAAPHAPSLASRIAVTVALGQPVMVGKNDV
jgi:hypothetical protein